MFSNDIHKLLFKMTMKWNKERNKQWSMYWYFIIWYSYPPISITFPLGCVFNVSTISEGYQIRCALSAGSSVYTPWIRSFLSLSAHTEAKQTNEQRKHFDCILSVIVTKTNFVKECNSGNNLGKLHRLYKPLIHFARII